MVTWSRYAPAAGSARVVPAVYSPPAAPERVVYRERRVRSGRSWKKSALVIGGSTGAGAGVGAIAGGKKGALVGAAIGGGAATLYEAMKHR
jgi:outer membrane lipoprotein SlyB